MKKIYLFRLALVAPALLCVAGAARAQTEQRVVVTVQPAQSVEERVEDEFKEKELRRVAEERRAAEESARAAERDPRVLLRRARTFHISSETSFFEPVQLQNELRKRAEFDAWGLAIIDGYQRRSNADVQIEIDRPAFTYLYTYKLTDRLTGVVLATGKLYAFDGNVGAPKLARRIVEEIRKARGEVKSKD
jgi:hypothetical protein